MQLGTLVKVEGSERECYDPLAGVIVLLPAEMPSATYSFPLRRPRLDAFILLNLR